MRTNQVTIALYREVIIKSVLKYNGLSWAVTVRETRKIIAQVSEWNQKQNDKRTSHSKLYRIE